MTTKLKLDMKHHRKFCQCCGKESKEIWKNLMEQKPQDKGEKVWEGHTQYKDDNYFYDTNMLNNCGSCGEELEDEDIKTIAESREFWGAPCSETIVVGYKCSKCGHDEVH